MAQLDISLFDGIESQTGADDRRSMLAIQAAVADRRRPFAYLEIGSHLGGSIQPYLLDRRCTHIVSIDKRSADQPDERGSRFSYPSNSTDRMLENLRMISDEGVAKVTAFDADSGELKASLLPSRVDVCFIDGEHTNPAVERDFAFCESALTNPGVVYFHDSNIVFQALGAILTRLETAGRPFHAYNLPRDIFLIDLGMNLHEDPRIRELLAKNHLGYLSGLQSTAHYREFYNGWLAQGIRAAYAMRPIAYAARTVRGVAERMIRPRFSRR